MLYPTVKGLMHTIRTEDKDAQYELLHQRIHIVKPCTVKGTSGIIAANEKSLSWITQKPTHHCDLMFTDEEQSKLQKPMETHISQGA